MSNACPDVILGQNVCWASTLILHASPEVKVGEFVRRREREGELGCKEVWMRGDIRWL